MPSKGVSMSPKQVAETLPDVKMRFKDAFPYPGVVVMMGQRGSGKTATAMWVMEELHKTLGIGGVIYKAPNALKKMMPDWVEFSSNIKRLPHECVVIIDEAQQEANSRRSGSDANLDLANAVALSRQRKQLIFLISHHSRKLDMVDVMDASRIVWKQPSAGQVMFERKEIKPFSERAIAKYEALRGNKQRHAYCMDFSTLKFGFTKTNLPSFWSEDISTGMADLGTTTMPGGTLLR